MRAPALALLALGALSCSDGQSNLVPADEPIKVRGAQFIKGAVPGTAPVTGAWNEGDPARITSMSLYNVVPQGFGGKKITGQVTTNASATGLAMKGLGTGWWLQPAGDIDTSGTAPVLTLSSTVDFSDSIAVGDAHLIGIALDANGVAGPQYEQYVCVFSSGPAGTSTCPGGTPAPAAAITLTWDTQVDLDLQVLTPDGKLVTPKHPYVDDPDKKQPVDPSLPHIDRDSNPGCAIDGVRRESLIWPTDPADPEGSTVPAGVYGIYVNFYSACNQQAVRFHVQVMTAVPGPPDADAGAAGAGGDDASNRVEHVLLDKSGELIAAQATPSAPTGLFVTEYNFQ